MSFTEFEIDFIKDLLKIGKTDKENISKKLPREIFEFLKEKDNIKTIIDRAIYRQKTKSRPFDSLIVTKFLHKEIDIKTIFSEILAGISGDFLLYIDFHFLILVKSENNERVFKFQHASKSSALNETYKIFDEKDSRELLKELSNKTLSDFLNDSFINHRDIFEYHGSGFSPFMLLSLVFTVQKLS